MSMMWVKKQSKWAIIAAAVLIGGSLIVMDLPSSQGMSSGQSVGEVGGEEISAVSFQQEFQNYVRSEEARAGRPLNAAQQAQIRENLFQFRVQNLILQGQLRDYGLYASVAEMQNYLMNNPSEVANALAQYEGPESVPAFLRDSALHIARYREWLAQDSVYDRPGMRALERQLKTAGIPQLQLQQIFRSQVHRTDLEEIFLLEALEDRATLRYYRVAADDFPLPAEAPGDDALRAHFEASPDSFWFRDEAARLNYVRLPLTPSTADSALMRDFAGELRERALAGESFEDLARSYSGDAGSAENGGRLPPAARDEWVPGFAGAAFALAPGGISEPVLTPYGWHVILLHEKIRGGGAEKAVVSHILLNVTAGTETSDSVLALAESLQEKAEKSGLRAAAEGAGLEVEKTAVFEKGTLAPLGTYVQGLASFTFGAAERKAKISEPLQTEEAVYLLERDEKFPKGRDFERAREAVARDLARAGRLEAARAEAERVRPSIAAAANLPARVGGAVLETGESVAGEAYVAGFGFGGAGLFRALRQSPGEWGPVLISSEGAVIAQVVAAQPLPAAEKARRVRDARGEGDAYQASNLYQSWARDLPKTVRVRNHLDEVYRN